MLHDYAHLHTATHTIERLSQLHFEVSNPLYTPVLASSDYHVFPVLRDALRGCHFASDLEMKEAVHVWLATQPEIFFFF
jgi:hypothetical protein